MALQSNTVIKRVGRKLKIYGNYRVLDHYFKVTKKEKNKKLKKGKKGQEPNKRK